MTIAAIVELPPKPRMRPWLEEDARPSLGGTRTCSAKSKRERAEQSKARRSGKEKKGESRTWETGFGGECFGAGQEPGRGEAVVEEEGGFGGGRREGGEEELEEVRHRRSSKEMESHRRCEFRFPFPCLPLNFSENAKFTPVSTLHELSNKIIHVNMASKLLILATRVATNPLIYLTISSFSQLDTNNSFLQSCCICN